MSDSFFASHGWKFSFADGQVIASAMKLFADGSVGAYVHPNERCWSLHGDTLVLKNISGVPTSKFVVVETDGIGPLRLEGASVASRGARFTLERVKMPSLTDLSGKTTQRVNVEVLATRGERRKNLVFVSAGPTSSHVQWPRYIDDADRNWDLCTSWYGDERPDYDLPGEFFVHQPRTHKLSAIYNTFHSRPDLLQYDRFWIPDDDIEVSWKDINRLFNIFARLGLSLGQPSLRISSDSYVNHLITAQDMRYLARFTTFVEIMCPLLSRELLDACLPAFNGMGQPYIIDHIMAGIEGRIPGRTAIIDDVAVVHSRPLGANYDPGPAFAEGQQLAAMYFNTTDRYDVIGGIFRDGITF